jgi:hypothetical protein
MSNHSAIHVESTPENGLITAWHRDFPEIRTSGSSPAEAVKLLGHQLQRALDSALTDWRRTGIIKALEEARSFQE